MLAKSQEVVPHLTRNVIGFMDVKENASNIHNSGTVNVSELPWGDASHMGQQSQTFSLVLSGNVPTYVDCRN